ncbi:hypothetical protein GO755_18365 [Spirosoma sp. HMF4905]|uniref:DUF3108 domain-containing protein n=1 Tax=Spirosoma arboris TaxID=2682092 RepID=A0A7K1SDZ5_9BACT|nr:hypothetical protein [Spirosoma arboris]MVM32020.1 hypothetical protein [Spirosoma arboris]
MKQTLVILGVLFSLTSAVVLAPFPQADISNGIIQAKLYLPDPTQGYYQGVRFDWSGVFASLDYKGHSYFGQWFEKYDPKLHDAISGPVEEFTPIGYETAKPGEDFLKIGVGSLRKSADEPYRFSTPYETVKLGKWSVKKGKDAIEFTHELIDAAGYSYRYRKTVRLLPRKPTLVLEHSLTNTGAKPIETTVYDHNFYVIDKQPTGPDFSVTFPFALQTKGTLRGMGTLFEIRTNQLTYLKELSKGETTHCYLTGFGDTAKDYDIRIENKKTGAGVRITCDQPIVQLAYWSMPVAVCPEPYIQIKAEPGKEFTWKIQYDYYAK